MLVRKTYPKIRTYSKGGQLYYRVDLRRKHYQGQKFKQFNNEAAAKKYAAVISEQAAKDGINSLTFSVADEKTIAWQTQCGMFGKTIEDAVNIAVNVWMKEKDTANSPLVTELLALWLEDKKTGARPLRAKTKINYRNAVNVFNQFFKVIRIREVSDDTIEEFLKWKKDVKLSTKKYYARYLQGFFNYCIRKKYTTFNPANHWVHEIQPEKTTAAFYTVEQCKELMKVAMRDENKDIMAHFALCLFGGIRPEEADKLKWEHILFDTKEIFIPATISKTKHDRRFEMSETLFAWLNYCDKTKPLIPQKGLRYKKDKVFNNLSFENIQDGSRHTFATFYYAEHKSYEKLRNVMGNSPDIIRRNYQGTIGKDQIEGFNNLTPEWINEHDTNERVTRYLELQKSVLAEGVAKKKVSEYIAKINQPVAVN